MVGSTFFFLICPTPKHFAPHANTGARVCQKIWICPSLAMEISCVVEEHRWTMYLSWRPGHLCASSVECWDGRERREAGDRQREAKFYCKSIPTFRSLKNSWGAHYSSSCVERRKKKERVEEKLSWKYTTFSLRGYLTDGRWGSLYHPVHPNKILNCVERERF